MLEYCYVFMIRIYEKNRTENMKPVKPEWIPDEEKLEEVYDSMIEKFQDALFKSKSKDTRDEFLEDLTEGFKCWLQPHFLRNEMFGILTGTISTKQ